MLTLEQLHNHFDTFSAETRNGNFETGYTEDQEEIQEKLHIIACTCVLAMAALSQSAGIPPKYLSGLSKTVYDYSKQSTKPLKKKEEGEQASNIIAFPS